MSKEIKVGDLVKVKWTAPHHVGTGLITVCSIEDGPCSIYARDKFGAGNWYDPDWLRHLNWIEKLFYKTKD